MQHLFIYKENNPRLIVIFAGWAMDNAPFMSLRRPGYDIMVVWDYRDFSIDWSCTAGYGEICVVAWSLGVYAAAASTAPVSARITLRLAVNGTLTPVDAMCGIPPAVFRGTLDGLDERNLTKFYRRVAGSREAYACFADHAPQRDIAGLKDELEAFLPREFFAPDLDRRFDRAIICRDDAIFPAANQWRAWENTPRVMIDGAHLPDFQAILDRYVLDKEHTGVRFAAGAGSYEDNATVQEGLVERMRCMMELHGVPAHMCRRGSRTIEIGSGTGKLSRVLDGYADRFGTLEMWDIAADAPIEGPRRTYLKADAELQLMRTPSGSADFIASASTVQWFNSPSRFLGECARILTPGGLLLVGTYAAGNLASVEAATGRGLPLLEPEEWTGLAPDSLEVVDAATYTVGMEFDSAADVFHHLKSTGVNSLGRSTGVGVMRRAMAIFPRDLDGKYRIEYRPTVFMMRKK